MTIKTIERSLSREYNVLGLKEWKGARMVAEINETEDEYECGKELERKVEKQLTGNPNLTDPSTSEWTSYDVREVHRYTDITPPPVIDRKAIERLEILIDDAKTIEELAIYEDDAWKHGLKNMWLAKKETLGLIVRAAVQKQSMG